MNSARLLPYLLSGLSLLPVHPVQATFTSLYVFGDGVCTTTAEPAPASLYHGGRFCNGRVWIELLSEWQGIPYDSSKNDSYFGHDSEELLANIESFPAPGDASTALFVVWSNNADFVEFSQINIPPWGGAEDESQWSQFIAESVANHEEAVTALYDKGARTLLMPLAADIAAIPFYTCPACGTSLPDEDAAFLRARVIQFNAAFKPAMEALANSLPGLTIHLPDIFSFFDDVINNPADYDLINPGIDAASDGMGIPLDGPGADYVFWDPWHPSARFQMHLAGMVQQTMAPLTLAVAQVNAATVLLDATNIPLGWDGYLDRWSTQLGEWVEESSVMEPSPGGDPNPSLSVPKNGSPGLYRLRFPIEWSWP